MNKEIVSHLHFKTLKSKCTETEFSMAFFFQYLKKILGVPSSNIEIYNGLHSFVFTLRIYIIYIWAFGSPLQSQHFLDTNFQLITFKLNVSFPEINVSDIALVSQSTFRLRENSQKTTTFKSFSKLFCSGDYSSFKSRFIIPCLHGPQLCYRDMFNIEAEQIFVDILRPSD